MEKKKGNGERQINKTVNAVEGSKECVGGTAKEVKRDIENLQNTDQR